MAKDPEQLELDLQPKRRPIPKFFGNMALLRQLVEEERGNDGRLYVRKRSSESALSPMVEAKLTST